MLGMTLLPKLLLPALLAIASISHAEPKKAPAAAAKATPDPAKSGKPEDFVLKLYAEHAAQRGPMGDPITQKGLAAWFSKGFAALLWKEVQGSKDEVNKLDFDIFYAAQDMEITKLRIASVKAADGFAAVTVAFHNFDKDETVRLNVRRIAGEGSEWRVCNIIYDDFDLLSNLVEPDAE